MGGRPKCPTRESRVRHRFPGCCDRGERVLPENFGVGLCGPLLEALTLFQTKICDFPYPISDLTQNSIRFFRPLGDDSGNVVKLIGKHRLQMPHVNQEMNNSNTNIVTIVTIIVIQT